MLVDRGLLSYSGRIAEYWPEFAQHGKGEITIADLMRSDLRSHVYTPLPIVSLLI